MPAAARVHIRAGGQRTVSRAAVGLMAVRSQPWIVTAPLLPHELQQLIRQVGVRTRVDREWKGFRLADTQEVSPRLPEVREIQFRVMFKLSPRHAGHRPGLAVELDFLRLRVQDVEGLGQCRLGKRDGDLGIARPVADLIGADENFLGGQSRQSECQERCGRQEATCGNPMRTDWRTA
jgi:hypothetical protein